MNKIMFNDKYGLTNAVLNGYKTMTRRVVGNRMTDDDIKAYLKGYKELADKCAKYKIDEIVAVAQSYEWMANSGYLSRMMETSSTFKKEYCGAGWNNKMFVKADLMPHQIRITDINVERLQDISEEDCLKEGITYIAGGGYGVRFGGNYNVFTLNPNGAFAALIDKVSGKGTWENNPYVFAYTFELVK